MFKPLEEGGMPQLPGGSMGFVKDAFRALQPLAAFELRLGARFDGHFGEALRKALGDAARLIATMPATHLTFADDQPVFPTSYGRMPKTQSALQELQQWSWPATAAAEAAGNPPCHWHESCLRAPRQKVMAPLDSETGQSRPATV
jgi:hypothetical protein